MLWTVLSLETKMIAMFGCAIIIALSILIIICFLIPDTWWILPWTQAGDDLALNEGANDIRLCDYHHQWQSDDTRTINKELSNLNREEDHERFVVDSKKKCTTRFLSRNELCYDSSGYSMDSGRPGSNVGHDTSSNGSSIVGETPGLSPSSSRRGSTTTLPADELANRPQVHLTLRTNVIYQSDPAAADVKHSNGAVDLQLVVTIENATDLPSRSYVDTVDPSVSVRLERRTRLGSLMGALIGSSTVAGRRNSNNNNNHNHIVTEDSTCPVVYHSRHPRFHHTVTFNVPKSTQLKDCQLVVRVEDKDKLVGTTEIGESRIDLRDLDLLVGWLEGGSHSERCGGESTVRLSRFIDIFKAEEKGAILLGLSFLPTSQRITVNVTQCNRLVRTADSCSVKAVVRLFLLNESGRVLKKRKTAPFDHPNGGGRIELNELFHLDVEIERWDRCVILIVLSRIQSIGSSPSSSSTFSPSQKEVTGPPIYHHSGHVALGKRVLGHAERIHWNSAFQSPRRVISQWHCLH